MIGILSKGNLGVQRIYGLIDRVFGMHNGTYGNYLHIRNQVSAMYQYGMSLNS